MFLAQSSYDVNSLTVRIKFINLDYTVYIPKKLQVTIQPYPKIRKLMISFIFIYLLYLPSFFSAVKNTKAVTSGSFLFIKSSQVFVESLLKHITSVMFYIVMNVK